MQILDLADQRIRRSLYRRRTSVPFLSGDAFASLADFLPFGTHGNSSPPANPPMDKMVAFVPGDYFDDFLEWASLTGYSPKVLITGNSDRNFSGKEDLVRGIDLWLCQNCHQSNSDTVRTIPLGLENYRLGRQGLPKYFRELTPRPSSPIVLVPSMRPTNPIRGQLRQKAESLGFPFQVQSEYVGVRKYLKSLQEYSFVLCPEGNGADNLRVWETLYLGRFPVIKRTDWSVTLESLGLPLLYFDELDEITEQRLISFADLHSGFDPRKAYSLWIPYWADLIERYSGLQPNHKELG